MITSSAALRATREWIPNEPTNPDFPGDDGGWMGQVPPPELPKPGTTAPTSNDEPVTGHESQLEARENGWLGQVPPSSSARSTAPAAAVDDAVTGYETAYDARESGWIGQVPPPPPPAHEPEPAPTGPTYAIPELAPEPWKSDPPNDWSDPTLFG